MSQLGTYFDHGAERIGYSPGAKALPEYDRDDMDYSEVCPTLMAYLRYSMQDFHVALAKASVDLQLQAFPVTDEGLEQTAETAQRHLVPEMLSALTHAACVGSGSIVLGNVPEGRDEFVAAWEHFFGMEQSKLNIGMIEAVYSVDDDLMDKIMEALAVATKTVQHSDRGYEDAMDLWHHGGHMASVACYLIGFEMGKQMAFESTVPGIGL